jgi:hypothetical protein
MNQNPNDLNLNYVTPVVSADGHVVLVSDQGVPSLLFFQARNQHEGHLHADVVAAVRLNNVKELKDLNKAIAETIKKHETREP